ncbi:MAG: PDZ domain-containing protein [Muribaculaceae bacterium]|nr:PDZ domain-containing protein [Muribaculaceae bacterium]
MKKTLFSALAALAAVSAMGEAPLWIRDVAIAPDGQRIAFTYKGDIFTVPVAGGGARQLTSDKAFDSKPIWTPDGKRLVFRSDREGSDDIFIMNANGGALKRLTTSSIAEQPLAFLNDSILIFSANEMPARGSAQAPILPQTYSLNVNQPGTRPSMFLSMPMLFSSNGRDGKIIFTDKKGYEDVFRKHERSSGTNDIWLYDNGDFRQLTDFNGHDRNAVWAPQKDSFFFLSEEDGTINVYAADLSGKKRKLTSFEKHPVRNLSVSEDGVMAFSWDGELYTLTEGGQPQKVSIDIIADDYDSDLVKRYVTGGASAFFPAPKGNELAIVIRGDVYVTDAKYKTTKRITNTPDQERTVSISPDGKTMVYDSDRDGYWQLFTAKIKNPKEEQFAYATEIVEEPLYKCETSAMQPVISPDGKKVAFLENRSTLKVIDIDTKKVTTALDGKYNYSYSDGDQQFAWSPDSQWLLMNYIGVGGWNNIDIALIKADGSEVIDLTESGFSEGNPKWVLGGKGIAFESAKYGMKNTGSWGNQSDIILMALDGEAWDDFNMTEEEADLKEKGNKDEKDSDSEKENKEKKGKKDQKGKKGKKDDKADKKNEPKFVPDLANRRYRTKRLTENSAMIGDFFLTPKGEKLYYTASSTEGKRNLYCRDLKKGDVSVISSGIYSLEPDAKGENLFLWGNSGIKKMNLSNDKIDDVEYEALYDRSPSKEREYIYDHMLRQVNDKFYDENLHGVDWIYYGDHYRKFLPYISNNRDFAEMLSEILGELNASHTGGRAYGSGAPLSTASLGAYFDESYDGEGLKIAEIIARGPLSTKSANVQTDEVILAIDGQSIAPHQDVNAMLDGKAGKKVRLSVRGTDGKTRDVTVRPISMGTLSDLSYDRWVERNERTVDSLSGGKIGYIHVKGMNTASYQNAYERLLGKYRNCDAVVVDTRYNGGGWLHNDLAILLNGKEYARYSPRGQYIGSEPWAQWTKPSAMLVNECNYSDASGTPYVFQTLGIGDVVGAPIPGTMTAVWWETQIDPSLVFGIPQVTNLSVDGKPLENQQLNPNVLIFNAPADVEAGRDAQLEGAVKHLLKIKDK